MTLPFTRRQIQVIAGYARGNVRRQVAAALGISQGSVKTHTELAARRIEAPCVRQTLLVHHAYTTGQLASLKPEQRDPVTLPLRLWQCLDAMARGITRPEQAAAAGISVDTVRSRRTALLRLLDARTAAHAVALGHQMGLLDTPRRPGPQPACPHCGRR